MPSPLALLLTLTLIAYLLRRDWKKEPLPSNALWLPLIWLLISGSRQPGQWLSGGGGFASSALHQGNPIDQAVYGTLILAGALVLVKRRARFQQFAKNNWWILLFFFYEGISFIWSDFPFITLKRWIKATGDFVMVFVLLSDPYPVRAIIATIRRSGYVLILLSILFCKYYEHLGRSFDSWGRSYYTGVTLDKNMFGYLLFAYGLFFASGLVNTLRQSPSNRATKRTDIAIHVVLLAIITWLIPYADSKTSLLAMFFGIAVLLGLQFSSVKRRFGSFLIAALFIGVTSNMLFSVKGTVLEAAGRNATLTGRTGIWEVVLDVPNNPIVGTGYASFWLGERLYYMWEYYPRTPLLQAHNGYIEVYINLGLIGVFLISGVLWTAFIKARRRLLDVQSTTGYSDYTLFQSFGMAYILAYPVYNITEATFSGLNFLFIIFLMLAFDCQHTRYHENLSQLRQGDGRRAGSRELRLDQVNKQGTVYQRH